MSKYVYAIRKVGKTGVLVEFDGEACFRSAQKRSCGLYKRIDATQAHAWVKEGGLHETALYLDGNRVRRAKSEEELYKPGTVKIS